MSKKVTPIIIGIIVALCIIAFYAYIILPDTTSFFGKIIMMIISVAFVLVTIYVVKQRVDEIESGEENDISKY